MKNNIIITMAIVAMAALTSCKDSNTAEEATPQQTNGMATLTFRVTNYEQYDLDSPLTRSTDVTNLAHLTLAVYDATTLELAVDTITQSSDEVGYGTFTLTLPFGDYKLVVLGYNKDNLPDMTNPEAVSFADDYVPYVYRYASDITVGSSTELSQSIALSKTVAAFKVIMSDAIPDGGVNRVSASVTGGGKVLNALTGYATQTEEYSWEWSKSELGDGFNSGLTDRNVTVYTFLTEDEATMSFTINCYDSDNGLVMGHTFTDVPMQIGWMTVYRGNFFTVTGDFTITLADDFEWDDTTKEYNY